MQHSGGVCSISLPPGTAVPCRLTGLANSDVSYHLVEGGQVKKSSPNSYWPEVRGPGTVTLCQDSRRRTNQALVSFPDLYLHKREQNQGRASSQLSHQTRSGWILACSCCNCCPTDPRTGVFLSNSPPLGLPSYPERLDAVRYLFYALVLTQQARLSFSVGSEVQQAISSVGSLHCCPTGLGQLSLEAWLLTGPLRIHTPVGVRTQTHCYQPWAKQPDPMKRMVASPVGSPLARTCRSGTFSLKA